jgi:hypothetical protein
VPVLGEYSASMGLGYELTIGKTQTGSNFPSLAVARIKALEQTGQLLLRHSRAFVLDPQ